MNENTAIIRKIENEFYEAIENDEITNEDIENMTFCDKCPLKGICGKEKLYFGCGVWEEMMGQDL